MFTQQQIDQLSAPLERANVRQRAQAGRQFSYIESWHAIAEANRIFGFGNWSSSTTEMRSVSEEKEEKNGRERWRVSYIAKVRITVHCDDGGELTAITTYDGYGAGHGIDNDLGQAHESASKEAESDAQKRALRHLGNAFGLALYDKDQNSVVDSAATLSDQRSVIANYIRRLEGKWPEETSDYLADLIADYPDCSYDLTKANAADAPTIIERLENFGRARAAEDATHATKTT
jgi:DNA recombination protein Rad52